MAAKKTDPRIARMDRTANKLLSLIEGDTTNAAQKGRLFAQCMAWHKMRATLLPESEGDKLKEMQDAVKSQGGKRSGGTGLRSGGGAGSRGGPYTPESDGVAIKKLIANLPLLPNAAGRDPKSSVRKNGRAPGDGGGLPIDGGGHVPAVVDGIGNSSVV